MAKGHWQQQLTPRPLLKTLSGQPGAVGDMGVGVEEGQMAPDFVLQSDEGGSVRLSDLRGKKVILYFYPKDDTPGCTKEACDFRDNIGRFRALGAEIIGVSNDSVESHRRFKAKYGLNFPLLSDPDAEVSRMYGVYKLKRFMGREHWGIERSTFIIGEDGRIIRAMRGVRVDGHVDELLGILGGGG